MHYIGMAALHASAHMTHSPSLVAASFAIAIVASGLALRLATGSGRSPRFVSATALGFAIAGMHYTAMAAITVYPHAVSTLTAPALSVDLLAMVVAVVAFVVSGLFLLILVPERAEVQQAAMALHPVGMFEAGGAKSAAEALDGHARLESDDALPIDGATLTAQIATDAALPVRHLPVEHDGARHLLSVDSIVAVHANAHYTYVFDGVTKYFCPLAIGDVESRLDPARFARVHRSHIINVDRIVRLKRAADAGLIELRGRDPYTVPVSRSRLPWVRAHLTGAKASAAV
jgi:DNA-binding LytR/AlgR family response regulator